MCKNDDDDRKSKLTVGGLKVIALFVNYNNDEGNQSKKHCQSNENFMAKEPNATAFDFEKQRQKCSARDKNDPCNKHHHCMKS
mmetsp:Transcript_11477/g.20499  ORF Transcript_11477/g.20499 Transcript_11477/m.20499 type:complete len:83 (+) Transcript_11477:388-636(+)